jgi:hypothetical protein
MKSQLIDTDVMHCEFGRAGTGYGRRNEKKGDGILG